MSSPSSASDTEYRSRASGIRLSNPQSHAIEDGSWCPADSEWPDFIPEDGIANGVFWEGLLRELLIIEIRVIAVPIPQATSFIANALNHNVAHSWLKRHFQCAEASEPVMLSQTPCFQLHLAALLGIESHAAPLWFEILLEQCFNVKNRGVRWKHTLTHQSR